LQVYHAWILYWPVLSSGSWQPFWLFQTQLADGGAVPALLQGLMCIERETETNVLPLYLCYRPGTSPSQRVCQCQCVQICWSASNCVLVFVQKFQWDVILNSAPPLQAVHKVSSRFGFDASAHGLACNGRSLLRIGSGDYRDATCQTMPWQRYSWYNFRFMRLKWEKRFIFTCAALKIRLSGFDISAKFVIIFSLSCHPKSVLIVSVKHKNGHFWTIIKHKL